MRPAGFDHQERQRAKREFNSQNDKYFYLAKLLTDYSRTQGNKKAGAFAPT